MPKAIESLSLSLSYISERLDRTQELIEDLDIKEISKIIQTTEDRTEDNEKIFIRLQQVVNEVKGIAAITRASLQMIKTSKEKANDQENQSPL